MDPRERGFVGVNAGFCAAAWRMISASSGMSRRCDTSAPDASRTLLMYSLTPPG